MSEPMIATGPLAGIAVRLRARLIERGFDLSKITRAELRATLMKIFGYGALAAKYLTPRWQFDDLAVAFITAVIEDDAAWNHLCDLMGVAT